MSMLQEDEAIKAATPTKLQRELSTISDVLEGWLEIPKQGNLRKYGWILK